MEYSNELSLRAVSSAETRMTAVEWVEKSLAAIDRNKHLNAFMTVHEERARKLARSIDEQRANPCYNSGKRDALTDADQVVDPLGLMNDLFHGVPLAIKDNIDEAGVVCSAGSRAYEDRIPEKNAEVVDRLQDAGAVIVGRTNMHELADGVTSENPHYGRVHNPFRRGFHPGGSSGGSAVSVAAGCVTAALGTDTGGSIRIPAALCGIVGFKPTMGVISTEGVFPLSPTLDHAGPMAGDVFTIACMFFLLAGNQEPSFSASFIEHGFSAPGFSIECGLRIGVLEGFGIEPEKETGKCFENTCKLFQKNGHNVAPVQIPILSRGISVLASIYGPEAAEIHGERLREVPHLFGADARKNLERARGRKPEKYSEALSVAAQIGTQVESRLNDFDYLICPTTPFPAKPFGAPDPHLYLSYTCPFNITGHPAVSIPMGFSNGLPVGLQIIGRKHEDIAVLAVAATFEEMGRKSA